MTKPSIHSPVSIIFALYKKSSIMLLFILFSPPHHCFYHYILHQTEQGTPSIIFDLGGAECGYIAIPVSLQSPFLHLDPACIIGWLDQLTFS